MVTKMKSGFYLKLFTVLMAGSLLVGACAPLATETPPTPTTAAPTATIAPTETAVPTATPAPAANGALTVSLDLGGLASEVQTEMVPATPADDSSPYWSVLPAYTLVNLPGYPISSRPALKPQIFIYPLEELGKVNEGAGKMADSLKTLVLSPQEITPMPFLPLLPDKQVMHSNVQYLDFKSGQGLRYLTQYNNGHSPINNDELFYTYQGLTRDGKYYVAALLPVKHPSLPADGKLSETDQANFSSEYLANLDKAARALNTQAANTFSPDLTRLDAMLSSLEIK